MVVDDIFRLRGALPLPVHGRSAVKTIFAQSVPGRCAWRLNSDAPKASEMLPEGLLRKTAPRLPECSELDVVRHFTRLSQLNYSVDANFYPLGSCTMAGNVWRCG